MPVRILLTNDDGIASAGLRLMAEALHRVTDDLVVAAPAEDLSGCGTSLGAVAGPLTCAPAAVGDDLVGLGVAGSPAAIVAAALLGGFGDPPDVVVSGVNRGRNTGRLALHSGTVGAAMTAAASGLPAIAVSCDGTDPDELATASAAAVDLAEAHAAFAGCVMSLNLPAGCGSGRPPLSYAHLSSRHQMRAHASAVAVADGGTITYSFRPDPCGPSPASDNGALDAGRMALTAFRFEPLAPDAGPVRAALGALGCP